MLEVRELRGGYGAVEVLRGVSLAIHAGEIVAVLGSNGAGKSTLNNTLCGLLPAFGGKVTFDGTDLTRARDREIVAAGLIQVPEGRRVFPNLSVHENLELARALATKPRLLLLDEVLAGLNPQEIAGMIPVVQGIRESGVTVLMIEHVMQAVMNLADEVYVLNNGRLIARGAPAAITNDPQVIEAYLGHGTAERLRKAAHA